jgi:hypothetical protein
MTKGTIYTTQRIAITTVGTGESSVDADPIMRCNSIMIPHAPLCIPVVLPLARALRLYAEMKDMTVSTLRTLN